MTYPVADHEQEITMALRAAAHSRWIELRELREPRDKERRDVFRVDRIAQTFAREGVERWAAEHKFYEGLDRLRKDLDEIAKTDFRQT
jgi:hypothetical protein